MKKLFILFITAALVCTLCSCGLVKNLFDRFELLQADTSETEAMSEPTETYFETTAEVEETVATTEPVIEPTPLVVCANSYEKEAIDAFFPAEKFGFTHKVEYPKIDSDKSGATALNEAIAQRYEEIIQTLKDNREENVLYHITYTASECSGVIFINITEDCGWQYSEGYTSQRIYYYDALNDKELSLDEYLTVFGIDRDKIDAAICSSYELSCMMYEASPYLTDTVGGESLGAPATDTLYYAAYESYASFAEFAGVEFIGGEGINPVIRAHLTGGVYVSSPFTCDIYADSYIPVNPNYAGYSIPAGAPETGDIVILFDKGKVTSLTAPPKYGIQSINYSASAIKLVTKVNVRDSRISINGCEPYSWGSGELGNADWDQLFIDTYYVNEYIPINELKSIVITVIEE